MQDKAVEDLTTIYVPAVHRRSSPAPPACPRTPSPELMTDHVLQTKAIVDAQAKGDWKAAYAAIRDRLRAHADDRRRARAGDRRGPDNSPATPPRRPSTSASRSTSSSRSTSTSPSFATDAALGGRTDEFAAAGAALNTNGTDIGGRHRRALRRGRRGRVQPDLERPQRLLRRLHHRCRHGRPGHAGQGRQDLTDDLRPAVRRLPGRRRPACPRTPWPSSSPSTCSPPRRSSTPRAREMPQRRPMPTGGGQHMQMIGDPLAEAIVAAQPESFE